MRLELLTCVWGKSHIELFKRACLFSLTSPKNLPIVQFAKWNIYTDDEQIDYLRQICNEAGVVPNIKSTSDLRDYTDPIQSAIISQIKRCIKNQARLLMAPPDTIFADGALKGLIGLGLKDKTCVVVPHPRVLPTFLDGLTHAELEPRRLVSKAWQHLHKSWTDAEVGHERQNSFVGGVAWESIKGGTGLELRVKHVLPTPYLLDFTDTDLLAFQGAISSGDFDHVFPSRLVEEGRQVYCTDSDQAFMIEVTEPFKNIPPIWPGDVNSFWRSHPHNEANKNIRSIFRGE